MLRFFRASRSIQVGTPEVRARSPFSRGRALARSPIGRMRHPVYTKSRLSAAAESLLFGICIRKRYSISLKRPSGPRRFCAVQVFWPKAKTLMPGHYLSRAVKKPGAPQAPACGGLLHGHHHRRAGLTGPPKSGVSFRDSGLFPAMGGDPPSPPVPRGTQKDAVGAFRPGQSGQIFLLLCPDHFSFW